MWRKYCRGSKELEQVDEVDYELNDELDRQKKYMHAVGAKLAEKAKGNLHSYKKEESAHIFQNESIIKYRSTVIIYSLYHLENLSIYEEWESTESKQRKCTNWKVTKFKHVPKSSGFF